MYNEIKKDRLNYKKTGDTVGAKVLTTLLSEVQRNQKVMSDVPSKDDVVKAIKKMMKGYKEVIEAKPELIEETQAEMNILKPYLPQQMSVTELTLAIEAGASEIGASSIKDMGKLMGYLSKNYKDCYDGKMASELVKSVLLRHVNQIPEGDV